MSSAEHSCDLFVAGAGMAGMAAALFASAHGLSTALAGTVGGIDFTTGYLDLLAVHPVAGGTRWADPWAALAALVRDEPEHPYARVGANAIRTSLRAFTDFLAEQGLAYEGRPEQNVRTLTCAGTLKTTYLVPGSMWQGVLAAEARAPCLLVDFQGLKGYSARQIVEVRKTDWPQLQAARIPFPGFSAELFPEHLAQALADPRVCDQLADAVRPHLAGEKYVGFPAALGLFGASGVQQRLEHALNVKAFEIPTLPPSLAGIGLRAAFERALPARGVTLFTQKTALSAEMGPEGFTFQVGGRRPETTVRARMAVLATGRFFGKGLAATRSGVREPLFHLPVVQPPMRADWHAPTFFHQEGHPVNRAGVATDTALRPLGAHGAPAHPHLRAAGTILAHQDWMRAKCGAGLAIATAYKCVESLMEEP